MSEVVHKEQEEPQAIKSEGRVETQRNALRRPLQAPKTERLSGFHRTASAVRTVLPLLQKMLPLLDGNVASAVANLVAPGFMGPTVDLHPLERAVESLHTEFAAVHEKDTQQDAALKRIDQQLEGIREALERTELEQRETAEEVRKARRSSLLFFLTCMLFLVVSVGLNVALFLYVRGIQH
jgi:hypothetical protein